MSYPVVGNLCFAVAYPFVRIEWVRRMRDYYPQSDCPLDVTSVFRMDATRADGRAFLCRFAPYWVRGDWHRLDGELAAFVRHRGDEHAMREEIG